MKKIFAIIFFLIFLIAFSAISLYRYHLGQVFYYDFGIFANIIWQLSRFHTPYINHIALGNIIFLGDHFNPGLVFFAPLFWLTFDLRILLLEQAFALTASGLVVFFLSRKANLNYLTSLILATSYLLFAGSENPLVTDWHPESTAALSLLLFYYFYKYSSKKVMALSMLFIFFSFKESNALSAAMLLIPLLITLKEKRRLSALLIIISLSYFFVISQFVIPSFSHKPYLYTPDISYSPVTILQNFFNKPEKIKLIKDSFSSFGFLPLLSATGLIPVIAELSLRLAPNSTIFNNLTLGQHYNVLLGVFLVLATISGFEKIKVWSKDNNIIQSLFTVYLFLVAVFVARKITGAPINLALNKTFWKENTPQPVLFNSLTKVPPTGSVMSQNNLLSFTANRIDPLFLINENYKNQSPSIILFDLTPGQNINNFYGANREVVESVRDKLQSDHDYHRIEVGNKDFYIYVKN